MVKYFATYGAAATVLVLLDLVWLGVITKPLYQAGIGHLMAEQPNIPAALLFYAVFVAGLVFFAIHPNVGTPGLGKTVLMAALYGFFTYATYDLTNLATLKNWPVSIVLIDVAWGCVVSAAAGATGKFVFDRFTTR